ncbi:MAG: hypothetical protein A2Z11_04300 [Candidatus Woykebacteria bacterium RBG_16_43_9]|uniref:Lycopene cyclase domain-containing protein n=1 Tax=Candidatus Woykebacteria bacterium RBG_16_43_9 TaxID=1802596 RepID=A0A1G1WG63_9BACT|nr:MAG: hypothetical protein A2Z11_04300 [Candidatus Woykebacteria bacterium RBG_16_43_9]
MSLLIAPFAIFDLWFVPEYWNPKTLFNWPIGVEGFAFAFASGGIAAVLYEEIARKGFFTQGRQNTPLIQRLLLILGPLLVVALIIFTNLNLIYALSLGLGLGVVIIAAVRRDLLSDVFFSGFFFGLLYLGIFILLLKFFPDTLIVNRYNFANLSGFNILEVPIEEFIWAVATGAFVGPLYEFLVGLKLKHLPSK